MKKKLNIKWYLLPHLFLCEQLYPSRAVMLPQYQTLDYQWTEGTFKQGHSEMFGLRKHLKSRLGTEVKVEKIEQGKGFGAKYSLLFILSWF